MKLKSILTRSLSLLALVGILSISASAADASKPTLKKPDSGASQIHHTGGLYFATYGDFLALLPKQLPASEIPGFWEKISSGDSWNVTSSYSLDGKHGLVLFRPTTEALNPAIVQISGLPSKINLGAKIHFKVSEQGFVVIHDGVEHLLVKKAEMQKITFMQPASSPGVASTK